MKRRFILVILIGIVAAANVQAQCGPPLPAPSVKFVRKTKTGNLVRYTVSVTNHAAFSNAFFAPSPHLPACESNASSARTWLDVFDANSDSRLHRYCELTSSAGMRRLDFLTTTMGKQPKAFYITLDDRLCHQTKKSNVAAIP